MEAHFCKREEFTEELLMLDQGALRFVRVRVSDVFEDKPYGFHFESKTTESLTAVEDSEYAAK